MSCHSPIGWCSIRVETSQLLRYVEGVVGFVQGHIALHSDGGLACYHSLSETVLICRCRVSDVDIYRGNLPRSHGRICPNLAVNVGKRVCRMPGSLFEQCRKQRDGEDGRYQEGSPFRFTRRGWMSKEKVEEYYHERLTLTVEVHAQVLISLSTPPM